jgi:hypothetical protein
MGVFPNLESRLDLSFVGDDDEALIRLHFILFGNGGSRSSRKRQVGLWRPGSSECDIKKPQIQRELSETLGTVLKEICLILRLDIGIDRASNEASILQVLTAEKISPKKNLTSTSSRKQVETNQASTPHVRRQGRPRKYNEDRALVQFLKRKHPLVFSEWEEMDMVLKETFDAAVSPEARVKTESPIVVINEQAAEESSVPIARPRGRPRKNQLAKVPGKRGRPRKTVSEVPTTPVQRTIKKRGRPKKAIVLKTISGRPRFIRTGKRGRPRKVIEPEVPNVPLKRGRGRPRKLKRTTSKK